MTDTAQDFGVDFSFEAQHDGATMDADKLFVDATGKSKNFFRRVSSAVKKTVKKAKDRRESRYADCKENDRHYRNDENDLMLLCYL